MSRISRVFQKIFAASASNNGQFGSAQDGSKVLSSDLAVLMANTAWPQGWLSAVLGADKFPPLEEFQALHYITTTQLAYLLQQGIPEYDASTTYYQKNIVVKAGTYQLYGSVSDSNTGNALTDAANWQFLVDLSAVTSSLPESSVTGASHTYASADSAKLLVRSNSASAMTDTLPGTSGALANGWYAYVKNADASASLTIAVGSGGTINQGILTGSIIALPGETWFIESQGTGVYNAYRAASAVLHASPTKSSFKNLVANYVSNTTYGVTADELVLEDANGNTRRISGLSQTLNTATSGAGGLDTGSLAASTWYYTYAIFNPSTNTKSAVFSASSTSPTLPAGYTYASGPISAFRTDGSLNIIGFVQKGRDWQYQVGANLANLPIMASGASGSISVPTWTAVSISNFIPPIALKANICVIATDVTSGNDVMVAPNNSYGNITSTSNPPPLAMYAFNSQAGGNIMGELILESTNLYYAAVGSTNLLTCVGFTLNL